MPLRWSARIRARGTAVMANDHSSADVAAALINEPDKSWCLCGGTKDGPLMLYCDQQSVGCCVWYHFHCLGLSQSDVEELGATDETFVCPNCACRDSTPTHHVLSNASIQYSTVNASSSTTAFKSCTDFFVGRDTG